MKCHFGGSKRSNRESQASQQELNGVRRISLLPLCVFLILTFLASHVGAQSYGLAPIYVGIEKNAISGISASQKTPMWCWAACIEMVLRYYNIEITQEDVVYRTYGIDAAGNLPVFGAKAPEITRNLNNWSFDRNGKPYVVRAALFPGTPRNEIVIDHLKSGRPIILGYGPDPDSGHVVVLTALSYVVDQYGRPYVTTLIVRDPFPDNWGLMDRGRKEYVNGMLPAPIQWMWIVDAKRAY